MLSYPEWQLSLLKVGKLPFAPDLNQRRLSALVRQIGYGRKVVGSGHRNKKNLNPDRCANFIFIWWGSDKTDFDHAAFPIGTHRIVARWHRD